MTRKTDARRGRRWSYTAGSYPHSVRVYERTPGGPIYGAVHDPTIRSGRGGERRESLGHRDRQRAMTYADEQAVKLREGLAELKAPRPTLGRILKLYLAHRTPDKALRTQSEDRRQAELFVRLWGFDMDLRRLSRREWDQFQRLRRSGSIDPRGKPVEGGGQDKHRAGNRTLERDLRFVRAVCRWATDYRDLEGRRLLPEDPTRGLALPKEANPRRPVATHDRVDAIRTVFQVPTMTVDWGGKRRRVETYLPELFEIVVGTGRRIGAVRALRLEDLRLEPTPQTPHGAIVWPADTDKMSKEWRCPISAHVRAALESAIRKRPRVGDGPLFPAPENVQEPIRYELARGWLKEAEILAGLEPQERSLWHAYRRLWASVRKDLPDVDVAQAGGWSSLDALKLAYQQPDDATMLKVVEHGHELRAVQ